MKFKILIVFIVTLIVSMFFLSETSFASTYTLGDVNQNGKVDLNDYIRIKMHFSGKMRFIDEKDLKLADINENGYVTLTDFVLLKQILMGVRKTKTIEISTKQEKIEILTKQEKIEKELIKYAKEHPDLNFSVGISNLNDNEEYFYNENEVYRSGCTIKAPYLWYSCLKIQELDINWKNTMLPYIETLDGTSVMRRDPKPFYTLKDTMELTGKYSDNSGYKMLVNKFNTEDFNKLLKSIGSKTTIGGGKGNYCTATVADRVIEWKNINKFMQEGSREGIFLKNILTNTSYDFIGTAIGKETTYMSGWVEYNGTVNDCAIVRTENPYILAIFTSDGKKYKKGNSAEAIANISNIARIVDKIWSE